ncbi:MAG TPA: DnaJ domain-containing protein [Spirochaetota bacterium]|nr:DnaJ domain-containing protein [Spirochaetota bacterium]HRZ25430.1 DnaJ domain-containing protein [Spirochaetota bacterium]HSA15197.1 DnaJ domain-containing protein [Spirochaetota bacterium]
MSRKIYNFTKSDLIGAYTLLFSETGLRSIDQIYRISSASLKTAYREKAKKNHPDRARQLGVSEAVLSERFKEITRAYNDLNRFIQGCSRSSAARPAGYDHRYRGKEKKKEHHNTETQPGRDAREESAAGAWKTEYRMMSGKEVPLGQYLLFQGIITLKTLIQAIHWQRVQRPPFGTIAREWKILTREEILSIFRNRRMHEKFGECALRLGYLNSFQHRAILCKQKNIQRPIGQFFVEQSILSPAELERHLFNHRRHNAQARVRAGSSKDKK